MPNVKVLGALSPAYICHFSIQILFKKKHTNESFDLSLFIEWGIALIKNPLQITDTYVNIFTLFMIGFLFLYHWISRRKILVIEDNKISWRIRQLKLGQSFQLASDTDIQHIQIPPIQPSIHFIRLKTQHQEFTIHLAQFQPSDHEKIQQCLQLLKSNLAQSELLK